MVLVICSGGLDSVVLAYHLRAQAQAITLLTFDYGQRHRKEIGCAAQAAADLRARHLIFPLDLGRFMPGNSLTDQSVEIPSGHYTDPSMAATVVPNRNMIMLSIAYGIASAHQMWGVAIGVHSGDHPIYPDCRPQFIEAFRDTQKQALAGLHLPLLLTPWLHLDKGEIVEYGHDLGVPFDRTWSCYAGGEIHCGKCGTCVERREAFGLAGVMDPTEYLE